MVIGTEYRNKIGDIEDISFLLQSLGVLTLILHISIKFLFGNISLIWHLPIISIIAIFTGLILILTKEIRLIFSNEEVGVMEEEEIVDISNLYTDGPADELQPDLEEIDLEMDYYESTTQ